ncbi:MULTISPECIES: hypothetical protein [Halorussus]|uniref:hypothetical protein n=1 Tax=Halorussus TaxID=1070314 RepID=UPI00209E6C83|nr:hypothetical protein [Halorussus vallis]USZ75902.1 hypothetical protein NGM07_00940 [Halorussus vallis]
MNPTDVASDATESIDAEKAKGRAARLLSALEPRVTRHSKSGTLTAATGVVSLLRAGRTFLKGNRKRGLLQALAGLFWVGVAVAQRRGNSGPSGTEMSDVVDTGPDYENVESRERDTDHATGEEVVDTTDADIDESDTAPEVDSDVDAEDVDQRDVADTDEVETAADSEESGEGEATDAEAAGTDEEDASAD